MAINPDNITTIRVDQLTEGILELTKLFPFAETNGELKQATIQDLVTLVATAVSSSGGVGYLPISVTDGQQLPDVPTDPSFFLCGVGTFLNVNGYPDIICTENLNAIMSLSDHWEIAVEIPINPLSGSVQSVTGTAVDNTDPLNPVINLPPSGVESVSGTTVDNTDPLNPIVNVPTLQQVTDEDKETTNGIGIQSLIIKGGDAYRDLVDDEISISSYADKTIGFGFIDDGFTIQKQSVASSFVLPPVDGVLESTFTVIGTIIPSITANLNVKYATIVDATFIDPTPVSGKGYIVYVVSGTTTINSIAYTSGSLIYRFYNGASWVTKDYNTVSQTITNGVTDKAPSEDAVFDALALKQDTLTETNFGSFANGLTAKTTPLDADLINIVDTADSNKQKKVTFTNLKAFLKTYFDTLYTTTSAVASQITTALSGYLTSATASATYQVILTASNLGSFINGLTSKTTPVDADQITLMDSADSNKTKKLSWANIKATLKTYFDTLYQPSGSYSKVVWKLATPTSANTGTASKVLMASALVTGGTISSTDMIRLVALLSKKTTATNTTTVRLEFNTSASLSGSTTLATSQITGTNNYGNMSRDFYITGGNIEGLLNTAIANSDKIQSTSGYFSSAITVESDFYLLVSHQHNTSTDSSTVQAVQVMN